MRLFSVRLRGRLVLRLDRVAELLRPPVRVLRVVELRLELTDVRGELGLLLAEPRLERRRRLLARFELLLALLQPLHQRLDVAHLDRVRLVPLERALRAVQLRLARRELRFARLELA